MEATKTRTSESTKSLNPAILKAQAKCMESPIKESGKNPHLRRSYADISDVLEVVGPATIDNGPVFSVLPRRGDQG